MPSLAPSTLEIEEPTLPSSHMREEISFLRNLSSIKNPSLTTAAVLNGDHELAEGIFPHGASVSIAYSLGATAGVCMEIFSHPDVVTNLEVAAVARLLSATLVGTDSGTASLRQGPSSGEAGLLRQELLEMVGSSERFDEMARLIRHCASLSSSAVVLPEDAPFPLACAALRAFPLVITPRNSFDDEVGAHIHVFVRGDILKTAHPSAWRNVHSGLAEMVGGRGEGSVKAGEQGLPAFLVSQSKAVASNLAPKERSVSKRRSYEKRNCRTTPSSREAHGGEGTPVDKKKEAERITKLEQDLRARGLII